MVTDERKEIVLDIVKKYNAREGKIAALAREYKDYSRDKFYADIKKLGIIKDKSKDKYIIPDYNIKGQVNLVEQVDYSKQEVKQEQLKDADKKVTERKKKTFEIDTDLEQLIRVTAAIEDISMNDYINKVLRAAIPKHVKDMIK